MIVRNSRYGDVATENDWATLMQGNQTTLPGGTGSGTSSDTSTPSDSGGSALPTVLSIIKGILGGSQPVQPMAPIQPISTTPGWLLPVAILGGVAVLGFVFMGRKS